jgi:hypothetical protein
MKKPTKVQVKRYIDNHGTKCLFCRSINIHSIESVQMDAGIGTQQVECHDCGEVWTDIVTLTNIYYQ